MFDTFFSSIFHIIIYKIKILYFEHSHWKGANILIYSNRKILLSIPFIDSHLMTKVNFAYHKLCKKNINIYL